MNVRSVLLCSLLILGVVVVCNAQLVEGLNQEKKQELITALQQDYGKTTAEIKVIIYKAEQLHKEGIEVLTDKDYEDKIISKQKLVKVKAYSDPEVLEEKKVELERLKARYVSLKSIVSQH